MGLASFLAPHITGIYDFQFIPLSLPTQLVLRLLSSLPSGDLTFAPEDAAVPSAGKGHKWIFIHAGKQINCGTPGGKNNFYEAKLEIPNLTSALQSPNSTARLTLKHTMLFSTRLMTMSSSSIIGLRSVLAGFIVDEGLYEAEGWLKVTSVEGAGESKWTEQEAKATFSGTWWVGERSGKTATKFTMKDEVPATPRCVTIKLHFPSFARLPLEETLSLLKSCESEALKVDEEGWISTDVTAWAFRESTKMETALLGAL